MGEIFFILFIVFLIYKVKDRRLKNSIYKIEKGIESERKNFNFAIQAHSKKEYIKAAYYFKLSAEKETPYSVFSHYSQYFLGLLYLKGEGVQKDTVRGVNWIAQSSSLGNAEAAYFLGRVFFPENHPDFDYKEVEKSHINAYQWLLISQNLNNRNRTYFPEFYREELCSDIEYGLEYLEYLITSKELKQSKKEVKNWLIQNNLR